jgi:hypothetical protein
MLSQQQRWAHWVTSFVLLLVVSFLLPSYVSAQDSEQPSPVADVVKRVALDPTTYAPAMIAYGATIRDWNSSQPFFQNGFVEHNARFTLTGRPDDVAVSYEVGRRRIFMDALTNLQVSVVNNVTDSIIERVLVARHPEHRTLWRTLGWIERISFASYMSYRLSADHFRQAQLNEQRAQALGLIR